MGQFSGALKPDYVIPFKLDKRAAKEALREIKRLYGLHQVVGHLGGTEMAVRFMGCDQCCGVWRQLFAVAAVGRCFAIKCVCRDNHNIKLLPAADLI